MESEYLIWHSINKMIKAMDKMVKMQEQKLEMLLNREVKMQMLKKETISS
jgi:hypothetical protein